YRKRHRTEDTNLVRMLQQWRGGLHGAGRAFEPEQVDAAVVRARQPAQRVAVARGALALDGGPAFAIGDVDDAAGDRGADRRAFEQGEHHVEERDALLGVEAAVDRVHDDERMWSAEAAQAHLLRQRGEALA